MVGCKSPDATVVRADTWQSEAVVDVAQIDNRQPAPAQALGKLRICLSRNQAIATLAFEQVCRFATQLLLLNIDRPRPVGPNVLRDSSEDAATVDPRSLYIQSDSRVL